MPPARAIKALRKLQALRFQIEGEIERLIDFLDATLPDTDLEGSVHGGHFLGTENDRLVDGELDAAEQEGCESELDDGAIVIEKIDPRAENGQAETSGRPMVRNACRSSTRPLIPKAKRGRWRCSGTIAGRKSMDDVRSVLFEMENNVHCACDFARAALTIAMHAKSLDADETDALARVAGQAVDHAESVRGSWRKLHKPTGGQDA